MAKINKLSLTNFRSHSQNKFVFSPNVTVIYGPNGSGKTSILEAIHLSFTGTVFRGSEPDMIAENQTWFKISSLTDDATERTVKYVDPGSGRGQKEFIVDGKKSTRMGWRYKHPLVLFEPDDLGLISGSPDTRRRFVDQLINQIDENYHVTLRRYERALRQRNRLLKSENINDDEMFAWNVALSEYGAIIIKRRLDIIGGLNNDLQNAYNLIAGSPADLAITYNNQQSGADELLKELEKNARHDRLLGFTSSGPHRHDISITFNMRPAVIHASRGEIRSIVIALKFLEAKLIEQRRSIRPIILLDDVFSELDFSRRQHIILSKTYQIIITTTENHSADSVIELT